MTVYQRICSDWSNAVDAHRSQCEQCKGAALISHLCAVGSDIRQQHIDQIAAATANGTLHQAESHGS